MAEPRRIFPVLMSGGAGTRLWPISRESRPKQMHALAGEQTLLQQAAARAFEPDQFAPLTAIASTRHGSMLAEQLRQIDVPYGTIVTEPVPRNTAAAAAVAALTISRTDQNGVMLLMPADHLIRDVEGFRETVRTAAPAAEAGFITLFGIRPHSPATGYGYIAVGEQIPDTEPVRHVKAFVEKPSRDVAEQLIAAGDHLWNSGIFLMPAATLLSEMEKYEPDILEHARRALDLCSRDGDALRLDQQAFEQCRSMSIDDAITGRTDRAAVVPSDFDWTDIGSWSALYEAARPDQDENVVVGDVLTHATSNSYLRSDGPLIATIGVENLIVVATGEAILVAAKDRDQEVREIVERLRKAGRDLA